MRASLVLFSLIFPSLLHGAIPHEGWYIGFLVGPDFISSLKFNLPNPITGVSTSGQINYNTSANGGGQIGYRSDKFRTELEFNYAKNTFNNVQIANYTVTSVPNSIGLTMSGNTSFFTGQINVYYELYHEDVEVNLVPYVGIGGGFISVQNAFNLDFYNYSIYARSDTAYAPIGQLIGGLSYFLSDTKSVAVDFRYSTTPKHQQLNSTVAVETINFVANLSFD